MFKINVVIIECPPGKFGIACEEECNCSMPCECDPATGFCNDTMNRQSTDVNYWKNSSQNCKY